MLASQESALRSQPPEADYRAATVKQRPTSRRITPAEISVSTASLRALSGQTLLRISHLNSSIACFFCFFCPCFRCSLFSRDKE